MCPYFLFCFHVKSIQASYWPLRLRKTIYVIVDWKRWLTLSLIPLNYNLKVPMSSIRKSSHHMYIQALQKMPILPKVDLRFFFFLKDKLVGIVALYLTAIDFHHCWKMYVYVPLRPFLTIFSWLSSRLCIRRWHCSRCQLDQYNL